MTTAHVAPVLVAGAGPVGLTMAHELARRGVPVRLVDMAAGPATTSRALATHARTLEIYDQMGVLADLLPRGQRVEHFALYQGGRQLIRFDTDYSRLPTRFPFTLMVDQAITEEVLRCAAARFGVPVEWGVRLTGLSQHATGVDVTLRHASGRDESLTVDWLVGCDGGHSTVRRLLDLPLLGDSSQRWLIADAVVRTRLARDCIHWINTGQGTVMLVPFPEPGKWRLLDTADTDLSAGQDAAADRFADKIGKGTGERVTVSAPTWASVFTIQQRMIPVMGAGRCFVAGDAAHVHSPASGQGMNTGIQDAYNLGWKLAAVATGAADAELLESYSVERVPVGRSLLGSTRTATGLVAMRGALQNALMPAGLAMLKALPPVKHRIERRIMGGMSALGLGYWSSPLTVAGRRTGGPPLAGGRVCLIDAVQAQHAEWAELLAELRDPRWLLLLFGGATPAGNACRDWLSVRQVGPADGLPDPAGRLPRALGIAGPGWLLVRPDGYVAARGSDASCAALDAALATATGSQVPAATGT